MGQYRLSVEAMNQSSMALNGVNSAAPNKSAGDVLDNVGRHQERMGVAGHQADHWVPTKETAQGAFAAVNQEMRTNPTPAEEPQKTAGVDMITGGQPVVTRGETSPADHENATWKRAAPHVGSIAVGPMAERPAVPPTEAIGSILAPDEVAERPFASSWAPPESSSAVQNGQASDIMGRMDGN